MARAAQGISSSGRSASARLEQARIDRLLDEAASLRRAADIRGYVEAVKRAIEGERIDAPADELARWEGWALGASRRIDPVKNRRFQRFEGDDFTEE